MHKWRFMLALLLGSSAGTGRAQSSQGEPPRSAGDRGSSQESRPSGASLPLLEYHAPAACPGQAFFQERMRARLSADRARVRAGTQLSVHVELDASGARGQVRIRHAASSAQRNLEAASCKEVVEGLALIAALALAAPPPERTVRAKPPAPPPGDATPARSPAPAVTAAAAASPAAPSSAAAPAQPDSGATHGQAARPTTGGDRAAPVQPAPAQVARVVPEDEAASEVAEPAADPEPVDESPPSGEAAADARLRGFFLDAGFVAIHGTAPEIQPGLQLGAAVALATGGLDWRLLLGARLAFPETSDSPQGTTHFNFFSGVAELCAAAALGSRWSWTGCAVVEPGLLTWGGENTRNAREYRRAWLALGAGTGFSFRLADWLGIRAGGELLVPTRRDQAVLAGDVVHQVPPVCARLELGVEARPW